jgi:hypothetical protein
MFMEPTARPALTGTFGCTIVKRIAVFRGRAAGGQRYALGSLSMQGGSARALTDTGIVGAVDEEGQRQPASPQNRAKPPTIATLAPPSTVCASRFAAWGQPGEHSGRRRNRPAAGFAHNTAPSTWPG